MPEHPALTRRQQFKVKSRIKEEKQSKKGKGKGKGAGKANGKSRGKGKGRKGKKGTKESKEQEGSKAKKKALSSKRVILLNKRKSAAKGTKEEKSSKHDASVECSEPKKIVKTDQVDVAAAAMETEHQKPKVLKKQRNKAGQTAKDKAETRAKASSKTTKRGKNNTETAKRNNKKNDSCKTTGKGKDKGKAKGKGKGKAGKNAGCTKTVKAVSDELLQGRFNINDLEVDGDLVCPAIKSYFTEIMAECQGCSECDGSVHDLVMPELDGLHFDMYYKRPAVGIRVKATLVASHAPEKTDQAPSKSAKSIGYFSSGRCMGTNVAMAKIFAS